MSRSLGQSLIAAAVLGCGAIATYRWNDLPSAVSGHETVPATLGSPVPATLDSVLDDAVGTLADNDPFRLANRPASVRYDPRGEVTPSAQIAAAAAPVRPVMTLKAIVGGPPWQAVVDGIPGQQSGTVVRAGSTFDQLVIRGVGRDSVVIQGPDTSWVLRFRSGR